MMSWLQSVSLIQDNFFTLGFFVVVLIILRGFLRYREDIQQFLEDRGKLVKFAATLPGPKTLPLIGNALAIRDTEKAILTLSKMSRDMNGETFRFWLGPFLKIVVPNPRDIQIIISSSKAAHKDDVYKLMEPGVVGGLINANGPSYRAHKKLIQPMLNGGLVMDRFAKLFNFKSRGLVKRLEEKVDTGEFDVIEFITSFIGDITLETLVGRPAILENGEVMPFLTETQTALHATIYRMARPWLYPYSLFCITKKGREYSEIIKRAHEFIDDNVSQAVDNYKPAKTEDIINMPLLHFLVDHMMKTQELTPVEIRYELITVFIAIFETLEGISCLLILMIAMHPEAQRKIRKEILQVMRNETINEPETKRLNYLDLVIRETIRLFPVGPVLPRKTTDEIKLSTCTLPKNCSVMMLPFAVHRDPKYWSEPDKFIPERFTPENSKDRHPYAYIPFSGGPRSCLGPRYALMVLRIMVAHLLRSYELTTSMKIDNLQLITHISTRSLNGHKISVKKIELSN
ncbi:cytochrome P450 4C1 isoform X2 [Fopius arisanus]|uniref:CYP4C1_4 protein n=2 Tax=Fopius arisanus TaxID=64838 RepID=A0A0C9RC41_9HYME|nr:PREDICTED: cytochrome P450 4C1-like isoform X2 [Fopius arisanus]